MNNKAPPAKPFMAVLVCLMMGPVAGLINVGAHRLAAMMCVGWYLIRLILIKLFGALPPFFDFGIAGLTAIAVYMIIRSENFIADQPPRAGWGLLTLAYIVPTAINLYVDYSFGVSGLLGNLSLSDGQTLRLLGL